MADDLTPPDPAWNSADSGNIDMDGIIEQLNYPGTFGISDPVYISYADNSILNHPCGDQYTFNFNDMEPTITVGETTITEEVVADLIDLHAFVKTDPYFKEHFEAFKAMRKLKND